MYLIHNYLQAYEDLVPLQTSLVVSFSAQGMATCAMGSALVSCGWGSNVSLNKNKINNIYTSNTNFSMKYFTMCKVYTDLYHPSQL